MSEKFIYLVTHGAKEERPNPGMTEEGKEQVRRLLPKLLEILPNGPTEIHYGTGKRQREVVKCLDFSPNDAFVSDVWGSPASLIKIKGKKFIVLADGSMVAWEKYKTGAHIGGPVIKAAIENLPNNSIICSGRPVLVRLGILPEKCQSGAIYKITVDESSQRETLPVELIQSGVNLSDDGAQV